MSYSQDKLSVFERAVKQEAEHKIEQLQQEMETYRREQMKLAEEENYARIFEYMQEQVQEMDGERRREVTQHELEARRGLILFRNELAGRVFEETEQRLRAFADSADYADYLMEKLAEAIREFPYPEASVLVRKEDMCLSGRIREAFSGKLEPEEDPENRIGGFLLWNREHGVLVDETFASRLETEKKEFCGRCGLNIQSGAEPSAPAGLE